MVVNGRAGGVSARSMFTCDIRQLHCDQKQPPESMSKPGVEGGKTRCGRQAFWSTQTSRSVYSSYFTKL